MGAEALSAKQRALLHALQVAEASGEPVDLDDLARRTTYSVSSIRTYFTKRLEGSLVSRDASGAWWVRGAIRCSEASFARRMSQKAGTALQAIGDEESWREFVRKLLIEGTRRGYRLSRDEIQLLAERGPEATGSWPSTQQPSLFDP